MQTSTNGSPRWAMPDARATRLLASGALVACLFAALPAHAVALPDSVTRLIPGGFKVLSYEEGSLTGKRKHDWLVVVHHDVDTAEQPSPRPLLIFTQNDDGTIRLAARNDTVVLQADGGGQCDPFTDAGDSGLAIKGNYFTVQNGVACGQHWTDYITFRYDTQRHDWLFHSQIVQSWHANQDPDGDALSADPAQVSKADPRHPVTFDVWRPKR